MPVSKQAGASSKRVKAKASSKARSKSKPKAVRPKKTHSPRPKETEPFSFQDPWKRCKSQYGGRLSPAEEFTKLARLEPRLLVLEMADVDDDAFCFNPKVARDRDFDAVQATHCQLRLADFTSSQKLTTCLVAVDLSHNSLSQISLPPECFIRQLKLSHNSFTGFPSALPHALLYLDFACNKLESIPESLGDQASNLRYLNMAANSICDIHPIAKCRFLEDVAIDRNQVDFGKGIAVKVR